MSIEFPHKIDSNLTLLYAIKRPVSAKQWFYFGTFNEKWEKKVFVRRVTKSASADKEVERDQDTRLFTGAHENIIRYFQDFFTDDFHYLVSEWCDLSVEDLFATDESKKDIRENIMKWLKDKDILRQATQGLVFLHSFNFVHRNIKPSNVLIAQDNRNQQKYVVKLSDFRTAKNLQDKNEQQHSGPASDEWIAPYPKVDGVENIQTDPKEDVFILGCFYYYVLDKTHRHPFGKVISRNKNIYDVNFEVYQPNWNHQLPKESQAIALIKDMIKYHPTDRPALKTILDRAYFLPEDYYKLYDVPDVKPGLCVIFNQESFKNEKPRLGSGKDKEALKNIFTEFGFDVIPHDNLSADQLNREIEQLVQKDYTNYACLFVCILSHGDDGVIIASDDKEVSIEDTKKTFCGNVVPSLRGKPKIWIIQACQGGQLQEDFISKTIQTHQPAADVDSGITASNPPTSATDGNIFRPHQFSEHSIDIPPPPDISRPSISDFLDVRGTIPGCASFRDTGKGSLLIRHLCEQMRTTFLDGERFRHYHFEDLLKKVQKEISQEISWIPIEEKDKKNPNINRLFQKRSNPVTGQPIDCKPCKQTIEWRSTLSDFIRFEKRSTLSQHSKNGSKRFKLD